MKKKIMMGMTGLLVACLLSGFSPEKSWVGDSPVDNVDVRIGTSNDGSNCVIGPQLPFGSINPAPQTPNGNMAGYDPAQPIRGFGQLHVSGIGWSKYGQIFVSPQTGLAVGESDHDSPKSNETAHPYEYRVTLDRYGIQTSFTPSCHSVIYRFIFPKSDQAHVLIDVTHNIPMDITTMVGGKVSAASVSIDSTNATVTGFGEYSGGFGEGNYRAYFSAEFSKKPAAVGTWKNGNIEAQGCTETLTTLNDRVGAFFRYRTGDHDTLYMKIAVSFKSVEQASAWLSQEIPSWDYKKVRSDAIQAWNRELSKIQIETASDTERKIFYTALYHTMLMPRNRTNDMPGFEPGTPVWDDHFAVWDTWRTLFPLMSLINPEMVAGNVNSFIARYRLNGHVRDAYIAGNDMAEEQGGDNIDNIIAEAWTKEIKGINWDDAYTVIRHDAEAERTACQGAGNFGISDTLLGSYKKRGWIPAGKMSCSQTLEFCYNDFCAAQIAKGLGKNDDYTRYYKRSQQWTELWNPNASSDGYNGFIVPKRADGSFVDIDLKKNWESWKNYFYEGNSWTYSLFVPQDFDKLVEMSGGKQLYAEKLNYAFSNNLIDYSNEPAFLAVYSFIYADRPDLASYWARKLMTGKFTLSGYPGNDDSGAMSSWYVFNALGMFPNAGQDLYYLTGALFKKTVLVLGNQARLVIEAENASKENMYIQSCTVNGKPWNKAWIRYEDFRDGATIKFVMGPRPSSFGQGHDNL